MRIENWDSGRKVLIVAEIGNNHEGDAARAEEMIGRAAEAGADAIKLQTFRTEHYVRPADADRFAMLQGFELGPEAHYRLKAAADAAGVLFIATPFDLGSAALLNDLVAAFKIASGDNTFYPLIEAVAATGKPVIVSGGLASIEDLRYARALIERTWRQLGMSAEMAVLHCVTSYPVPPDEANLALIPVLAKELGCVVGYSDHTLGVEAAVLAVAAGARIVEKHFTLDKNLSDFRDHQLSADPPELEEMVRRIREAENYLGPGRKEVFDCERAALPAVRRSIVAARPIPAGTVLRAADITWVRPAGGLAPGREAEVLGRAATRDFAPGDMITPDGLE